MLDLKSFSKQAKKLQKLFDDIQKDLLNKRIETTSGGGMVTVVADGQQNIVEIKIDPKVVDPNDVEMLEDLIVAAVNEAKKKAQELASEELSKLTGGIKLPGMFT